MRVQAPVLKALEGENLVSGKTLAVTAIPLLTPPGSGYNPSPLAGEYMDQRPGISLRFGPFTLDSHSMELRKLDHRIRLRPQALKLLLHLASRAGELVTREEIRATLWSSETFVDFEHGINFCVRQVRNALNDSAASPRYIETVARVGYRFLNNTNAVIESLAVLPFEDATRDPVRHHLADALPEALIRSFAAAGGVQVLAWDSVRRTRASGGWRRIAKQTGVGAVLCGKVSRVADALQLSVDLVDCASGTELWGAEYALQENVSSAVHNGIVRQVARVLRLSTTADAKPRSAERPLRAAKAKAPS